MFHGVAAFPEEKSECQISDILGKMKELSPITGFGNSDCTNSCQSHFFKIEL
jgi:Uri superfamily endonuclease